MMRQMSQCSSVEEQSVTRLDASRRRRTSIVAERMETLTQPDSILPARSRWQRSDKLFLNRAQRVCCPVLSDLNGLPMFSTSLTYFQTTAHRLGAGSSCCPHECAYWWLFDVITFQPGGWGGGFGASVKQVWPINPTLCNCTWMNPWAPH